MSEDLPRCPHGNDAVLSLVYDTFVIVALDEDGLQTCVCEVASDTEPRARRAWLALCAEEGGEA